MQKQKVLIVGATSAIAGEVARIYAERGARLFLIARNPERLATLVEELGEAVAGSCAGDLNDFDANGQRIEEASATLGGLDRAIVAHGLLGDQLASERDFATAREIVDTNLLSALSLLIPIANHMEAAGSGCVGVLGSVAGERGRPRNFTYGAAKSAVTTYLEGLRSRLYPSGVGVKVFKLGPVDTPMTLDHPKNALFADPASVARGIVRAMEGRRFATYLPWYWLPIMVVVRWLPEPIFQRIGFLSGR
ncbi:MAG: SDR family NAD(P)-dependent oxidoreductase [Deltaproteobacteria bacterium]|nr:SDR family NAD(P)-dependent oxidoreductase [Deltaproteobacteria bacterium]MBW2417282.1 SDR family NAD(P)-dependent oxidoreductase [Deltaproteobacteria bacterium]